MPFKTCPWCKATGVMHQFIPETDDTVKCLALTNIPILGELVEIACLRCDGDGYVPITTPIKKQSWWARLVTATGGRQNHGRN